MTLHGNWPCAHRFDGTLNSIAQQVGGTANLLDTFFGFLRRNTSLFAAQGSKSPRVAAKNSVLKALQKNEERLIGGRLGS